MAYERQYYTNGDVLNAEQLNHMEAGIKENSDSVSKLSEEKANRIVETASGEVIVVTDSAEAKPLGLAIDGKSEQNQYSGKNLLKNTAVSITKSGITVTVNDGVINVNGTSTAIVWIAVEDGFVFKGGTHYILSGCPADGNNSKYFIYANGFPTNDIGKGVDIIYDEDTTTNIGICIQNGVTVSNITFYPMIRLATETDDTYEPYCGGIPSPNPNYKQEIRNIGVYDEASGKYAVEVKGTRKNLFNIDAPTKAGYIISADGTFTANPGFNCYRYALTDSMCVSFLRNSNFDGLRYGFETDGVITRFIYQNASNDYFTVSATQGDYLWISINKTAQSNIQVEYGTVPTPYEPFEETTATVYLDEPLRKGDKAYWNGGSKVRGERYRDIEVFDGSDDEGWAAQSTKTSGNFRWIVVTNSKYKPITATNVVASVLCDQFIPKSFNNVYDENQGISVDSSGNFSIYDESCKNMTIAEWKAHLAVNPITVEYELAEPITEEIDIDLGELSMFYPTTILSNDCNANMEVTYIADTKAYIDKKFAELATAMV